MSHKHKAGKLIIVCGLPGSGKTTHAKQMEHKLRAVRLCPDEWITALGAGLWQGDFRCRVEELQWKLAQDLLALGYTIVIEWGTWARSERDMLREGARVLGAAVELHFLDAPLDVLLDRIRMRNMEHPPITLDDLMKWNGQFQRPAAEEMSLFDSTRMGGEKASGPGERLPIVATDGKLAGNSGPQGGPDTAS